MVCHNLFAMPSSVVRRRTSARASYRTSKALCFLLVLFFQAHRFQSNVFMALPSLSWPSQMERRTVTHSEQTHKERNERNAVVEVSRSSHALRFRQLLQGLNCSESTLAFVEGHRLRQMLRGINAIARSEPVALAFENLYEDLAPVRFACDVLFWRLERPIADAARHSSAVLPLEPTTSPADFAAARELFEILDKDGSGTLDRDELLSNALLRSLGHCEGCTCEGLHNCRSVDQFMQELDADGDGSITFLEFMVSASRVLFGGRSVAEAGPEVIEALLLDLANHSGQGPKTKDLERRFEDILATVRSWEGTEVSNKVLQENSSRARVLAGLLAGAKIPDLATALQVMYVDYFPLRVGGDLIFKIAKKHMSDSR